jgi:hypothetical protein
MTATNHALTGALIGLIVGEPLIAAPLALVSHFVCDVIPHYGVPTQRQKEQRLKSDGFRYYLVVDSSLCVALVAALVWLRPEHWQLAILCAFLAASPDLLWINRWLKARAGKPWHGTWFTRFAGDIQWFERPIGAVVEAAWFTGAVILLAAFIRA